MTLGNKLGKNKYMNTRSNNPSSLTEEQKEQAWLERTRANRRRRRLTDRLEINRITREYMQNNPEARFKRVARNKVRSMLRSGKWTRQPCEYCGKLGEAHHSDYSKPLDVRWLCRTHHIQVDSGKLS